MPCHSTKVPRKVHRRPLRFLNCTDFQCGGHKQPQKHFEFHLYLSKTEADGLSHVQGHCSSTTTLLVPLAPKATLGIRKGLVLYRIVQPTCHQSLPSTGHADVICIYCRGGSDVCRRGSLGGNDLNFEYLPGSGLQNAVATMWS